MIYMPKNILRKFMGAFMDYRCVGRVDEILKKKLNKITLDKAYIWQF